MATGIPIRNRRHARPEDKRLAYDPTVNYLILSLMDMDQPVLKAFDIDKEKNVTIEELVIQ